jgi:hypothetical protein
VVDHPDNSAAGASVTRRGKAHDDPGIPGAGVSGPAAPAVATADELPVRDLAAVPAVEVITRAAVMLMSAAAEKLGLAPDGEQHLDLDEARRLITALAGLVSAAGAELGLHRQPLREGLRSLQAAFREASRYPDEPGQGPGERLPV